MDSLRLYYKELANSHSTPEESRELVILSREGDEKAKIKLIKNYLLLVAKIANKYKNMGVPLEELIAEGNVGLITSIDKFNLMKGSPFSSCAAHWIKANIIRECFMNRRAVRLPENIQNLMASGRYEGTPFTEFSLDKPNEEGESMAGEIPEQEINISAIPFASEESIILKQKVERVLKNLKERDANVVKAFYGIDADKPLDVNETAEMFSLTTTRINQILRDALKTIKAIEIGEIPKDSIVTIISAKYGKDEAWIDVTDKIQIILADTKKHKASNKIAGDPCHGVKKVLIINFEVDGVPDEVKIFEGKVIDLMG